MSRRSLLKSNLSNATRVLAVLATLTAACAVETSGTGPESAPLTASPTGADAAAPLPPGTPASPAGPTPEPTGGATAGDAASGSVDAGDSGPNGADPCDLDGDGHLALGCRGGDDCCDVDAKVHPGVTAYFARKNACDGWDYDCDGSAKSEFGVVSCQAGFFSCSGDGFAAATPCGTASTFARCNWNFGCAQETSTELQRCR